MTSLGSISQQTTFFTHYSEHLSMNASDYLYQFCDFCLSFAEIPWSQKQNMQAIFSEFHWNSWWGNFSYWKVFRGFHETCCPIIKKRGNQLKYFQAPQLPYPNYVSLVFSTSTKRQNLVQMPIISGDKWLESSIAQRWQLEAITYYRKELFFIFVARTFVDDISYLFCSTWNNYIFVIVKV